MKFPIVIHHDKDSSYGVIVPDLPGCFSAGDTVEEAFDNAIEAIYFHLEGLQKNGQSIPTAQSIDSYSKSSDFEGGIWGLIDIDISRHLGK